MDESTRSVHKVIGTDSVKEVSSNEFYTADRRGSVHLHMEPSGCASIPPISVPSLLHTTASLFPDHIAMAVKRGGVWQRTSYKQYEVAVRTCAKALLKLGLQRYNSVCIIGFNSPEWFIADLAAMYAGGFACGIYTSSSPEACLHCAEASGADIVIAQDRQQVAKFLAVKRRMTHLKAIVQYEGEPDAKGVLSWRELMELGRQQPDDSLDEVMKTIRVNECCLLIFTSGTVGSPKAVMLSHDNLTYGGRALANFVKLTHGKEVIVSYLPLSHIAAQMADIYMAMTSAATVYFADKDALQGSLGATLQEVRPTFFFGVPRVFEKMKEKMTVVASQSSMPKRLIAQWAKRVGLQTNLDKMNRVKPASSLQYSLANKIVYSNVRKALGMDRAKTFMSGGAPLAVDVKRYFWSLDLRLTEGWGMSETSGAQTVHPDYDYRLESSGTSMTGCYTRINQPDKDKQGEVMIRGRNIFMGYLDDLPSTQAAFDGDGWFHTGDLGTTDADGFLTITGRIKELIITSGGENVSPAQIEDRIKAALPCVGHAVLVGDRRKFLAVLLTFSAAACAETGLPTDQLSETAVAWCREVGSAATTLAEVLADEGGAVSRAVREGIERANNLAVSTAQRVQKFAVLHKDLAVNTGELGPTMKVRRNVVTANNAAIIDSFYAAK